MTRPQPHDSARTAYLSGLEDAISALPHGVAKELRSGIAEELDGLEGEALARRISELGSPESVAAAAQEATADVVRGGDAGPSPTATSGNGGGHPDEQTALRPAHPTQSERQLPLTASRGYAITALIALGAGAIVIPVFGWIIGVGLVAAGGLWRRREKTIAILATPAAALLLALAGALFGVLGDDSRAPEPGTQANPLLPMGIDITTMTIAISVYVVAPLSAVWLAFKLRSRRGTAQISAAPNGDLG